MCMNPWMNPCNWYENSRWSSWKNSQINLFKNSTMIFFFLKEVEIFGRSPKVTLGENTIDSPSTSRCSTSTYLSLCRWFLRFLHSAYHLLLHISISSISECVRVYFSSQFSFCMSIRQISKVTRSNFYDENTNEEPKMTSACLLCSLFS